MQTRKLRMERLDGREMMDGAAGVGPTPNITEPASAVHLLPTMTDGQIDQLVSANPGKAFFLEAGTYHKVSIAPTSGQIFVGAYGAVMSGEGAPYAFRSKANDVWISNVVVYGYAPGQYASAIHADMGAGTGGSRWNVDSVEVYGSANRGVTISDGGRLTNSYVHDNAVLGVKVDGLAGYSGALRWTTQGAPVLVQNNVISHNNPANKGDVGWEAGGIKLWEANNVAIVGNTVSDNTGHGIWIDTCRAGNVVKDNYSSGNTGFGIFNEIANGTLIDNNTLVKNSKGIYVASSADVTVKDNALYQSGTVTSSNYSRSEDGGGWVLRNLVLSNNVIDNVSTPPLPSGGPTPTPVPDPPPIPTPTDTYTVSGVVRTGSTPLAGVKVYLYDMNWKVLGTVLTNAQGQYSFGSLKAGSYRLGVYPGGYVKQDKTITVGADTTLDFTLSRSRSRR